MKEIEVKVIEIDQQEVEKKLSSLGAKKIGEYQVESIIFDDSENNLNKKLNLLRLRKKGKIYLTFKEKAEKGFVKIAEETEVEVSDFEKMKLILEKIGFISSKTQPKKRITYKLKNSLVEIDDYFVLPVFLEVESPTEEELKEILDLFEFEKEKIKDWNGFELFKYYGKELRG